MNYFTMVGRGPGESQELKEAMHKAEGPGKKSHIFVLHIGDGNIMNLH